MGVFYLGGPFSGWIVRPINLKLSNILKSSVIHRFKILQMITYESRII